jgi:hypothetical protein
MPPRATISLLLVLLIISGAFACRSSPGPATVDAIDLVRQFGAAEKRPAESAFEIADYGAGGVPRPSIVSRAPSRLTWTLRLPARGTFHAQLHVRSDGAADETLGFRIGVSDDRVYEQLAHVSLSSTVTGWTPISADLSRYAGRKWSLFYRPDEKAWRLILSVDAAPGTGARAAWGAPAIATDTAAARALRSGKL